MMSINVPQAATYFPTLTQHVVALRNDFTNIINDSGYLTAMGGAAFLQDTYGISQTDAEMIVATLTNLGNLAGVYQGGAPIGQLNFEDNSQQLWGGQ
jgi:hypothetical protein